MSRSKPEILRKFNCELNIVVLAWLLTQSDEVLKPWGLAKNTLACLRAIPIGDIRISAHSMVRIDQEGLRQMLKISTSFHAERMLMDRALCCDARYEMLNMYTGISYAEYRTRREYLDLGVARGRIEILSNKQMQSVHKQWLTIDFRQQKPLRALCVLSELSNLSLSRIWASFPADEFLS